jgi:3-hydroxyisobutyrate dehydrogenase
MRSQNVAVLGLGAMGAGLAANIASAGFPVTVWNRTASVAHLHAETYGTQATGSAREAVRDADVVLVMVADDTASRHTWLDPDLGIAPVLKPGSIAIESSTVSPQWITELSKALQGNAFLEAPVIGSRPQLAARQLLTLVGGPSKTLDAARAVLSASSGRVEHVGPIGNAASMKLFVNALFAGQVALFAEIIAAIEQSTLDTETATKLIASLPITAPGLARIIGLIETRDFSPNFPIALVEKDLRYVTKTDQQLPMTQRALDVFSNANQRGDRHLDISGIANSYLT